MFSKSTLRKVSGAWVATESWTVTGTADKATAIEVACSHNLPHPNNPNMRAGSRDATNFKGPLSWIVTAFFTFGDHGACAVSPLDEPAEILAESGIEMVPSDTDIDGNAIVNSAGDPIDPPQARAVHTLALSVKLWVPSYNIQEAMRITDAINSDPFELKGAGIVEPGQCHCRHYKPIQSYTQFAPYVRVEFLFEFADATDPWQNLIFDMGRNGWAIGPDGDPIKGQICFHDGTPISEDVRLDGTGKPIDPKLRIFNINSPANPAVPIANPNPPKGIQIYSKNDTQTTLKWRDKQPVPFTGLV